MRRASASRASSATRGICSAISNRELELLEPSLTYRKQTKAPCSNRELSTNPRCGNSHALRPSLPDIHKWSRPLLTGTAPQREIDVTYRKQTTEKFLTGAPTSNRHRPKNRCYRKQTTKPWLTGARTHIRETRFCAKMNGETNEEMSAEMKAIR